MDCILGPHCSHSPFATLTTESAVRPHYYHHAGRLRQGDSEAVECYAQHA